MKSNLSPGDKIMLLDMVDEYDLPPGTKGVVSRVSDDPFEPDSEIINVNWDNGSTLALLSSVDKWKLLKNLKESNDELGKIDPHTAFMMDNRKLIKFFNYVKIKDFLTLLRDSGIVNMHGSSPLIYSGRDYIERHYGDSYPAENNSEEFEKLLDAADETKQLFISGLIKYCEANDIDIDDDSRLNSLARKLGAKLMQYYMLFTV